MEQFDHEKLDVYGVTLEFITWVTPLLERVQSASGMVSEVRHQLDRASLSILLNIAEGNAKRPSKIRAKFFDDARGSGCECAACLDALVAKGACEDSQIAEGKTLLVRIVSMLSKLVQRFDPESMTLREERESYFVEDEDEDENEDEGND
jgi:four helix bundle protein